MKKTLQHLVPFGVQLKALSKILERDDDNLTQVPIAIHTKHDETKGSPCFIHT